MKGVKISKEEKNIQTIYLFGLWIILSLLLGYVCLNNYEVKEPIDQSALLTQMAEQKLLLTEQQSIEKHIDTLNKMLLQLNPGISQIYLESGINYELEEINRAYDNNEHPLNHNLFFQVKDLYSMYYFDKKATWNIASNSSFLKKNLEECEVGFQQTQNTLTIQEALKNNNPTEK